MSDSSHSEEFFNIVAEKTLKDGVSGELVDDYFYYKLLNIPIIDSTTNIPENIDNRLAESISTSNEDYKYIYDYTDDPCLMTKIADTTDEAEDMEYFTNNDEIINRLHRTETAETLDCTRDPSYIASCLGKQHDSSNVSTTAVTTDVYQEDTQPVTEYSSDYLTYLSANAEIAFIDMCQLSKTIEEGRSNTAMANWALPKAYNHHSEMVNTLNDWYISTQKK